MGERRCSSGRGPGDPFSASDSWGFAPGWSRGRFGGDGGALWLGVPLGLQEPLLLGSDWLSLQSGNKEH